MYPAYILLLLYAALQGKYCETAGLTAPTGQCNAGYYCHRGAASAAPTGGISSSAYSIAGSSYTSVGYSYGGAPCPAGSYCVLGSVDPVLCIAGSYSGPAAAACVPCPPDVCSAALVTLHCHHQLVSKTGVGVTNDYDVVATFVSVVHTAGYTCGVGTAQ
eukprot:8537-Heterococcus_DN1.PRE.2